MSKTPVAPRFRHELKFVVDLEQAAEFVSDLETYCDYDKHSGETKSYEIASTYYDTADLRFYLDREESVAYRRKVRLRSYNTGGESTALFIEIKERHNRYVSKKRINFESTTLLREFEDHHQIAASDVIGRLEDTAEAREIAYLHSRLSLVPVVLVRYIRKALCPKHEPDVRITLDTRITGGGDRLNSYTSEKEHFLLSPDQGILEVKSSDTLPLWLLSAMSRYEFVHTRFSKYCLAVDAVYGGRRGFLGGAGSKEVPNEKELEKKVAAG